MNGRRSIELRTVPEDENLSSVQKGRQTAAATPQAEAGNLSRETLNSGGGRAGTSVGNLNARDVATGFSPLGRYSTPRFARNPSSRSQMSGLGRASLVARLQQGSRQLIDLGRLQANFLSNALVKRSEVQDYVNEEDQGVVALLARHVEVPMDAWEKHNELGGMDGHYWQTGYAPGEFMRNSITPEQRDDMAPDAGRTEEGQAQLPVERKLRPSIFGLPVIQPYNLFAVLWTMGILFLDLTYTAFWVPMNVAFCTAEYGKLSSGCTSSDLLGGALYFLNVLLGFQIGVVATNGIRKRTVVDGRLVAWLYIRYGRFLLDLVASIPMVYLAVVLAGQSYFRLNKGWVNCLSLLRLLRMVRLVSITKMWYMDSLSGRFQDSWVARVLSVTVIYSIFLAYQLAVAINLFACIMVLCAYFEGYEKSWMTAVSWANVPEASPLYQWYCAVYWMIVTATTTGFGDFQPRSVAEQVVANVAMVGGMIMFGVLVASIGQALSRATREAHQAYNARQKIIHVMDWAQHRNLPKELQKQVQNFFADEYGRKEEAAMDTAMVASLPSRLRAKVALSICTPLLSNVHILHGLPDYVQHLLAESMRPIRLPAGEDLCQQGDVTNCLWILQEGTVEAVRYKEKPVVVDAEDMPRLLGESVLLGEDVEASRVRPWTLRSVTPCRLWGITLGELYPLMRMYPAIGQAAAEYVKYKAKVGFESAAAARSQRNNISLAECSDDGCWCEVAAVIVRRLLEHQHMEEAKQLVQELQKTSAADGSLQPCLEYLLEYSSTRRTGTDSYQPGLTSITPRDARFASNLVLPSPPPVGTHGGVDMAGPTAVTTNTAADAPAAAPSSLATGGADNTQQQQQPHVGHVPTAAGPVAAPIAGTCQSVFSTPSAAATLTAALMAASSGQLDPVQTGSAAVGQGAWEQQLAITSGGGVPTAISAAATASPFSAVAAASMVVHCSGCQRVICPSCGQGTDPGPLQAAAAPPPVRSVMDGIAGRGSLAVSALRPDICAPATRAWANRHGTLQRVSLGLRADQLWAPERRSMEKRLGTVSVMSVYE